MSWRQSSLEGGGFLACIAVEPSGSGYVLAGGDVSGLHLSENLGQRWYLRNAGRSDTKQIKIACVKWSADTPGKAYACVGASGSGGGLFVSTDYGKTWSLRSAAPQFSGGNTKATPGLPTPHPRSTGNLLEMDESNGYTYAATFKDGLMRSSDGGSTWTTIGLGGGSNYCRGLAMDPDDTTVLYVSVYQAASASIYKVTDARGASPGVSLLSSSPAVSEELIVLGGVIYAACAGGIYSKSTASGDIAWTQLDPNPNWAAITGYISGGSTILYAGTAKANLVGTAYSCLKKSTDGGTTWSELTTDISKIHMTPIGRSDPWWLSISNPYGMMGNKRYVVSQIAVNPQNRNQIFVAGRSGAWRSDNGGTDWYPAVRELSLTIEKRVVVDPNSVNHIYVADTDWVSIRSSDRMATIASEFPFNQSSDAFEFTFDTTTTPSRAYIGIGDTGTSNAGGKIFSRLPSSSKWISEQFELAGASVGVLDNFARTASSSWGSADTGGSYTVSGGSSTEYNVTSSSGTIGPVTSATVRSARLGSTSLASTDGTITFSWNQAAAGANHEVRLAVRANTALDTYYAFGVRHQSSGSALSLTLRKSVAGAVTLVQNLDIYANYTLGTPITLQFSISGSTLKCSAWLQGDDPPGSWQISTTDTAISGAGQVAVLALRQTASTATPTFTFYNMSLLVGSAGGAQGAWPLGLAGGTDASSNKVLIAAANLSGIWRKTIPSPGGGTWSRVNAAAMQNSQNTDRAPMSWVSGSPYVWLFDRASGVWRSSDYGVTWTQVWAITSNADYTGFVAADPADTSVVWISRDTGLYKLTGADSGTAVGSGIIATATGGFTQPGPVKVRNGYIYVTTRVSASSPVTVQRSGDGGATWTDISSDMLRHSMLFVHSMDVDSDGRIYLSTNGNGMSYYLPKDAQQQQML